jgi:hypothetical protein
MGARARQVALDRFHPTRVAGRTRTIYEHAVRRSGRRQRV